MRFRIGKPLSDRFYNHLVADLPISEIFDELLKAMAQLEEKGKSFKKHKSIIQKAFKELKGLKG